MSQMGSLDPSVVRGIQSSLGSPMWSGESSPVGSGKPNVVRGVQCGLGSSVGSGGVQWGLSSQTGSEESSGVWGVILMRF